MTKIGYFGANLSHLFWQNSPLWVIFTHFSVKWFAKKLKNSKQIADVPPLPQESNFLRFLQKWDTLVVKVSISFESGEIGYSKSLLETHFGGPVWKNLQNAQNWPFGANLSHFGAEFAISIEILLRYLGYFISFDHSIALLGLILTGSDKWALFWRFGEDRSRFCWDIYSACLKFNQNCPFWAHPSHFGGKNWPLWVILSCNLVWNDLKKLKNSKNLLMYPSPPWNENFWDFSKNETLWW